MVIESRILKLAGFLRKAGIRVSLTEVQDCLKGLAKTDLAKPVFYQVLRSTLIKDHSHFQSFDRAFHLYFSPDFLERASNGNSPQTAFSGPKAFCSNDYGPNWGLGRGSRKSGVNQARLVQLIRLGDRSLYDEFVQEGIHSLGDITTEHMDNPEEAIRLIKVFLEWNMAKNQLELEAGQENSGLWWTWQSRFGELEETLKQSLEKEFASKFGEDALNKVLERENLNNLDFYRLNDNQAEEIRKKITRLGHRLATKPSHRKARAKKGFVDLPKTIRSAMNTGGVPINPAFRDRVPAKPEFWVLCDVSGSVKRFSEFMLQLTYSVQNRYLHVRSFVFVDTIAEASNYLQNIEISEGLAKVFNNLAFSRTGFSDYGVVFREFLEFYRHQLNKKITLLIIGDAKNNYRPDHADCLLKIKQEVKNIIWLNPLPIEMWHRDDGVIAKYSPYCTGVYECRNLNQLEGVAQKIFRHSSA